MKRTFDHRDFSSDLEKALCILSTQAQDGTRWMTAADISRTLHINYGTRVHWRTIATVLDKNKNLASRRKRNHRWQYSVLEEGTALITKPNGHITFIDPGKAVQGIVTLHDFLTDLSKNVRVCDPYLDETTIEHLDSCSSGTNLQLLTHNIKDSGKLRQMVSVFSGSGKYLEIRKTAKPVIHDRYIIDDKKMMLLGTSLNGFGKKQSFLVKAGQDTRLTMLGVFKEHWKTATSWP